MLTKSQLKFRDAIFNRVDPLDESWCDPDRLDIYRNNYVVNLTRALEAVYPVCYRLVGERCFDGLARRFCQLYPSSSPDLNVYGAAFPEFIGEHAALLGLPYLGDVVQLEWWVHEIYYFGRDIEHELASLSESQTDWGAVATRLKADVRMITSPYPIRQIWMANQPDSQSDGSVNLKEGGVCLLICAKAGDVVILPIPEMVHRVFRDLELEKTLVQS